MINKFISGLSANEKKILGIAALFLLIALFDRLLIAPSMGQLKHLDDAIAKEESLISQNLRFLSYRDRIVAEASAFNEFYAKDTRAEEEVIADFLKKIEGLASQAQVELSKVSPSGQEAQKEFVKYFITLDCTGKFDAITNFIYLVNNSKELLRIEKMNIAGNQRDAEKVQSSLTISKMIIGANPSADGKSLVKVQTVSKNLAAETPKK
ncbi:MAG: type 4a pilus biogenesis protein PilO [Candidatus Omnitrophica bacterium]|nr:type 4a pilus biogenesis protein PilO [Candidatus Omnitrophota bacterium]